MKAQPTNGALETKLDYIQNDIKEIKNDIKNIKDDFVSRREFEGGLREMEDKSIARVKISESRLDNLYKIVYWVIGALVLANLTSIFKLILK